MFYNHADNINKWRIVHPNIFSSIPQTNELFFNMVPYQGMVELQNIRICDPNIGSYDPGLWSFSYGHDININRELISNLLHPNIFFTISQTNESILIWNDSG